MKKYYFTETGNELQFGDMIELDFTKELKNGKTKYHHLECKFHPALIPMLLESGVIEEKGQEDKVEYYYTGDEEDPVELLIGALDHVIDEVEELRSRVKELEKKVKK